MVDYQQYLVIFDIMSEEELIEDVNSVIEEAADEVLKEMADEYECDNDFDSDYIATLCEEERYYIEDFVPDAMKYIYDKGYQMGNKIVSVACFSDTDGDLVFRTIATMRDSKHIKWIKIKNKETFWREYE